MYLETFMRKENDRGYNYELYHLYKEPKICKVEEDGWGMQKQDDAEPVKQIMKHKPLGKRTMRRQKLRYMDQLKENIRIL